MTIIAHTSQCAFTVWHQRQRLLNAFGHEQPVAAGVSKSGISALDSGDDQPNWRKHVRGHPDVLHNPFQRVHLK